MQTLQNNMQDNSPLVSFIVTAYNLPQNMLRGCLDSIVALSLGRNEREIIVVDDGSDTFAINDLADYDRDIVYVRVPNGGVSVARNIGLRMATGRFVQFVDGDDMLVKRPIRALSRHNALQRCGYGDVRFYEDGRRFG